MAELPTIPEHLEAPELVPELALHARPELVLGAYEPFGAAPAYWRELWIAGQALGRFLLDHREIVRDRAVVDVGTGAGVVALAAKLAGASRVLGVDRDPYALRVVALNAAEAGLDVETRCADPVAEQTAFEDFDVVVAADVLYDAELAPRTWRWLRSRARGDRRVLLADPGRAHLPHEGLRELASYRFRARGTGTVYEVDRS